LEREIDKMKKNDFAEAKALDIEALKKRIAELKLDLAGKVIERNMGNLKDVKSSAKIKKDIARLKTVMRQKELLAMFENIKNDVKGEAKE
jgi:large subunit ribosomal protein L29